MKHFQSTVCREDGTRTGTWNRGTWEDGSVFTAIVFVLIVKK